MKCCISECTKTAVVCDFPCTINQTCANYHLNTPAGPYVRTVTGLCDCPADTTLEATVDGELICKKQHKCPCIGADGTKYIVRT